MSPPILTATTFAPRAFVGALWRPANEGGLVWFLERVWPQIRQAEPGQLLRWLAPHQATG